MGVQKKDKEKKGKSMTQITMGMVNEPYWRETLELCEKLGIPATKPIKEILRQFMPEWNKLLKKQLEQQAELERMKEDLLRQKGGDPKKK